MQINIENYEYADFIDEAALTDLICQLAALAQEHARTQIPWQELTVYLLSDRTIAPIHQAVNGVAGSTDVITQRYDPFPGEPEGLIGEIFVNLECAVREGSRLRLRTPAWHAEVPPSPSDSGVTCRGPAFAFGLRRGMQGAEEEISKMNLESEADWSVDRELALYIAHGCDHLNDNEDLSEEGYLAMRTRELSWLEQLRLTPVIIKPIM